MKFLLLGFDGFAVGDPDGLPPGDQRRSLELFQSDVAPVLRERIPSRPLIARAIPNAGPR